MTSTEKKNAILSQDYFEFLSKIERIHKLFLDVIGYELEKKKIYDINNIQAILIYNLGSKEMTVGELTQKGYYLGSNISYNIKKLTDGGYVQQVQSSHDKRSVILKISLKGKNLCNTLNDILKSHLTKLNDLFGINIDDVASAGRDLSRMEIFLQSLKII